MTHPAQAEPHQIASRPGPGADVGEWPGHGAPIGGGHPGGPRDQAPPGTVPVLPAVAASPRRRPWVVAVLALVALIGGVVAITGHGEVDDATAGSPSLATVPLPAEPSLPPGTGSGALGDPSSIRAASAWVEALVSGDSDLARLMLCTGGLDQFPDGAALQAHVHDVVGGALVRHTLVDVERVDGRDLVVFDGVNDSGGRVSVEVSVLVAPQGRSICGFGPA
jgi:hypothetical protein